LNPVQVASLHLYPVKSLRGLSVPSAEVDALGLIGDRRFLVVDPAGQFLTQRSHPRMALIATTLVGRVLGLQAPGVGSVEVALAPDPAAALLKVRIWEYSDLAAEDCGAEPARLLSAFLDTPCLLARVGPAFSRMPRLPWAQPEDRVGFPDLYPFLAIGDGSLESLNLRLAATGAQPVPMDRFRPNLVLSGCPPHAEDGWSRVRIGDIVLRGAGRCGRCTVTTVDQATAERGVEPLRTLATYRRDPANPKHVDFGQYLIHETKSGTLCVGDPIEIAA